MKYNDLIALLALLSLGNIFTMEQQSDLNNNAIKTVNASVLSALSDPAEISPVPPVAMNFVGQRAPTNSQGITMGPVAFPLAKFFKSKKRVNTFNAHPSFACRNSACKKVFPTESGLATHMQVHSNKIYYCNICQGKFTTDSRLQVHIKKHTDIEKFRTITQMPLTPLPSDSDLDKQDMYQVLEPVFAPTTIEDVEIKLLTIRLILLSQ